MTFKKKSLSEAIVDMENKAAKDEVVPIVAKKTEREVMAEREARKQKIRAVFSSNGKMAIDNSLVDANCAPQWVPESRVHLYKELGFDFVKNHKNENHAVVVNTAGENKGAKDFLMQAPKEVIQEIEEQRAYDNDRDMRDIRKPNKEFPNLGLKQTYE